MTALALGLALGGFVPPSLDTQGTSCTKPTVQFTTAQWAVTFRAKVAGHLDEAWPTRANAMRQCGLSAVQLNCNGCSTAQIVPFQCGARTCPTCAPLSARGIARRVGARATVHDLIMEVEPWDGDGPKQKRSWRLVTFTSRADHDLNARFDPPALRKRVRHVRGLFGKFWRLTPWGKQVRPYGFGRKRSRRDTSYIYAQEVSPRGMVHTHVLVYGEYINQAQLQIWWEQVMKEPIARVHVEGITSVEDALREVLKYATKGEKGIRAQSERAASVECALRNVHRTAIGGALRRVKIADCEGATVDATADDLHDTIELHCHACGLVGEWHWSGILEPGIVQENGGFGPLRLVLPERHRTI